MCVSVICSNSVNFFNNSLIRATTKNAEWKIIFFYNSKCFMINKMVDGFSCNTIMLNSIMNERLTIDISSLTEIL